MGDAVGHHLAVSGAENPLREGLLLVTEVGQVSLDPVDDLLDLLGGARCVDAARYLGELLAPQAELGGGERDRVLPLGAVPAGYLEVQAGTEVLAEAGKLGHQLTTKSFAVLAVAEVPAGVVTVTSFGPTVRAGFTTTMWESEMTVRSAAAVPPKLTAVAPVKC